MINMSIKDMTREQIFAMYPYDVALQLIELSYEDRLAFYEKFSATELAPFFEQMDEEDAAQLIAETGEKAKDILALLDSDDAADILNEMDEDEAEELVETLEPEQFKEIMTLAAYDEDEAGSIMATNYIVVDGNKDIKDAMRVLTEKASEADIINPIFVTVGGKYYGALDLKTLICAKSPCLVKNITDRKYPTAKVHDDREASVQKIYDYDINALPVLDRGVLKGSITIDDATDVMEDERLEDYTRLAAIAGESDVDDKFLPSVWHRLPWLGILLVLDIFVCIVDTRFNNMIAAMGCLVLFQPIILNLAGNVGTQALATAVRDISDGKLNSFKDGACHVGKETLNSFVLGATLGIIAFGVTTLFALITKTTDINPLMMGLSIGSAVLASVTASGLFGALMPQLFKALGADPAVASGPFITTINDMLALIIYFGICYLLLF